MILPGRAVFTNLNCNLHYTPDLGECQGFFIMFQIIRNNSALPISDGQTVAVGVGACQNLDKVYDRADAANATGKQIKNTHADFAGVEAMSAYDSEKKAQ